MSGEAALSKMKEILTKDVPYGAKVEIVNTRAASGWNATDYEPYFDSALK